MGQSDVGEVDGVLVPVGVLECLGEQPREGRTLLQVDVVVVDDRPEEVVGADEGAQVPAEGVEPVGLAVVLSLQPPPVCRVEPFLDRRQSSGQLP